MSDLFAISGSFIFLLSLVSIRREIRDRPFLKGHIEYQNPLRPGWSYFPVKDRIYLVTGACLILIGFVAGLSAIGRIIIAFTGLISVLLSVYIWVFTPQFEYDESERALLFDIRKQHEANTQTLSLAAIWLCLFGTSLITIALWLTYR